MKAYQEMLPGGWCQRLCVSVILSQPNKTCSLPNYDMTDTRVAAVLILLIEQYSARSNPDKRHKSHVLIQ